MTIFSKPRSAGAETEKQNYFLLLAEDDLDDQELIIELVDQIDKRWKVGRTFNGEQVLKYLAGLSPSRLPDLLLLDYKMPGLNGEEVLTRLAGQKKYQAIPKIVLTSTQPGLEKERCLAAGATQYLVKSQKASEMKSVLTHILENVGKNPPPAADPEYIHNTEE